MFLAEGDSTDETFAKLKELGVRLALDDFGTGYSSLGYLKKAPFDKIKIDQSFVRGAASTTNRNAAIIRAIVTLAETLGMDTCAEGVETHDDLQLIRELGVSMVQGYIFGKPSPAETARELANSVDGRGRRLRLHPRAAPPADAPRDRLHRRRDASRSGCATSRRWARWSNATCRSRPAPSSPSTSSASGRSRRSSAGPSPASSACSSTSEFDLAPARAQAGEARTPVTMLRPWYVADQREAG